MRWKPRGRSADLEDRRGARMGGGMKLGLGGMLVLLVLSVVFKKDFFSLVGAGGGNAGAPASPAVPLDDPAEEEQVQFVSFILDDVQATWEEIFQESGETYPHATLVLFRDAVPSACGYAQSASGPFYCPGDQKAYVDLGFYDELKSRFGAPGDFAEAYVLAHEIGHHVQHVLGVDARMRQVQGQRPDLTNELSVRLELQADCYAGVWGHYANGRGLLEPGDLEEGLGAAAAIGDDRLQRMSGETVNPDAFTHGTAAQRTEWLRRGYTSGQVEDCDTFS